ncbi:hypothetical protein [Rhodococcus pyridinivorans]|uniref:DoxX-like protein n=1 Tax=Rhodococcus pyridinivorans TaxID=103816 RepID=A0A7M2XIB9_9NOCA|nr:hypothetical protein [Rhodococcus pyridinivorans]QOV97162.1 hypothetical protein INP59_14380 [Rhodococcus pyridinivorans]
MRHATQLPKTQYRRLRTIILATAAIMSGLRGLAYIPSVNGEQRAASLTYIETWLPLSVWGWVWLSGLAFLVASILVPRLAIPSMSVFVGMHVLWGTSFVMSWLFLDTPTSWITGSSIIGIAIFAAVLTILMERPRGLDPKGA